MELSKPVRKDGETIRKLNKPYWRTPDNPDPVDRALSDWTLAIAAGIFWIAAAVAVLNLLVILITPFQISWEVPGYILGVSVICLVFAVMKDGESMKNYE